MSDGLPYWTLPDLQARLSAEVVLQIFDDTNSGTPNTDAIQRLQADSDSFVEGYLRGIYDLTLVRANTPNQVVRLSLDYAVAQCAKRHPEYVRRDFKPLEDAVKRELEEIRRGLVRLDVEGTPEPGANQGGTTWDGSSDTTQAVTKFFTECMGDF